MTDLWQTMIAKKNLRKQQMSQWTETVVLRYIKIRKLGLLSSAYLNFELPIYEKQFLWQLGWGLKRFCSEPVWVFSGTKLTYHIKPTCHKWWQVKQNEYKYLWNVRGQRKTVVHVISFCSALLPKEFLWRRDSAFSSICVHCLNRKEKR